MLDAEGDDGIAPAHANGDLEQAIVRREGQDGGGQGEVRRRSAA